MNEARDTYLSLKSPKLSERFLVLLDIPRLRIRGYRFFFGLRHLIWPIYRGTSVIYKTLGSKQLL
jgi:hypothetical protein